MKFEDAQKGLAFRCGAASAVWRANISLTNPLLLPTANPASCTPSTTQRIPIPNDHRISPPSKLDWPQNQELQKKK